MEASFQAIDRDRSYVSCNSLDYFKMQALRLLPRGLMATLIEQVMRPGKRAHLADAGA